eukprot:4874444-Amphidinium_carterae.1
MAQPVDALVEFGDAHVDHVEQPSLALPASAHGGDRVGQTVDVEVGGQKLDQTNTLSLAKHRKRASSGR